MRLWLSDAGIASRLLLPQAPPPSTGTLLVDTAGALAFQLMHLPSPEQVSAGRAGQKQLLSPEQMSSRHGSQLTVLFSGSNVIQTKLD